jgi:hypothetical protein
MNLRDLDPRQKDAALNILCAAFHDYPVPRFVIGEGVSDYDGKLRQLINFFVEARLTRNIPLIRLSTDCTDFHRFQKIHLHKSM